MSPPARASTFTTSTPPSRTSSTTTRPSLLSSRSKSWTSLTKSSSSSSAHPHTAWHRSRAFVPSSAPGGYAPIALEDHEDDDAHDPAENGGLWAREVVVDDWVVVGGSAVGGSYVVWNCTVETLDGGPIRLMKRYSEFEKLRQRLARTFPNSDAAMPQLPPKSLISKFNEKFLEKRRAGLSYFLNCILLNPEFAGSPVLKDFLFS